MSAGRRIHRRYPAPPVPDPRTAEERLRAAALGLRDHIAGPFAGTVHSLTDDCWDEFYAALAAEPVPAPLDVDWGQVQAAFTNMVAVRDAPVLDDEFWMAVRAEYARLAIPPEPKP